MTAQMVLDKRVKDKLRVSIKGINLRTIDMHINRNQNQAKEEDKAHPNKRSRRASLAAGTDSIYQKEAQISQRCALGSKATLFSRVGLSIIRSC